VWTEAIASGVDAVRFYGGASIGMRTMLDAMIPAVEALRLHGNLFQDKFIGSQEVNVCIRS
jgi:DAK2 domain